MTSPVPVIDLTDSFTLVDHSSLSNVVIELDDSLNDCTAQVSMQATAGCDVDSQLGVKLTLSSDYDPRKIKITRKKREKAKSLREELIRERSPIGGQIGDCPICLERIGTKPLVSTKCGHVFCKHCLEQALHVEKKCPTCRKALRGTTAYHQLFISIT